MRFREKIGYIVVGGGLVLLGQAASHFLPRPAQAQLPGEQVVFEKVVCSSLTLVDPLGRPRVGLLAGDDGGVVAVFGRDGVTRVVIGADEQGGTFIVSDREGKPRSAIRVAGSGGSMMILGPDGGKRTVVGTGPMGGDVSVYANDGRLRGAMLVLENGAGFSALGKDGKKRAILAVDPTGAGSMQTYGNDGKRTGGIPAYEFDVR